MKIKHLFMAFAALLMLSGTASAKSAIAVLDVKAAMAAHPKTTGALKELEDYRKKQFSIRNKAFEDEVKKRIGDKDPETLTETQQRDLLLLRNDFEDGFERDVAKKDLELTDPIVKDIRKIVGDLAKTQGFEVVVDRDTVFYPVGGSIDITDDVIAKLKK